MPPRRKARRWIPALAALVGSLAAIAAQAQTPKPVIGSSRTPAQQLAANQQVWLPVFAFRSGFWVNLHHFLYLQARLGSGLPAIAAGTEAAASPADLSKLSPGELASWQDAVDYYSRNFARHELGFDSFLVRVNNQLGALAACPDLTGRTMSTCDAGLAPELTAVLEEAAPVYRAHWWREQDASNQVWIAQAQPLVRQYGGAVAELLARVYAASWPPEPIPIDVTNYAGQFGAYTTLDPPHVIVSSADAASRGPAALEVVFRQASQTLAAGVEHAIISQCQNQMKPTPRDLWPALVFYTASKAVSQALAGQPGKQADKRGKPYSMPDRAYVAARGWQNFDLLLERYWQPYLDGKVDSAAAIAHLVNAM